MKKLIFVLALFLLVGCSSSPKEHIYEREKDLEELQEKIEESLPEPEEQEVQVPILYDKAEGWNQVDPFHDNAVQVDEIFFKDYMKVSDFLDMLESSENQYTCPRNRGELLSAGDLFSFIVTRTLNGVEQDWISVVVENIYDETKTFEEAVVVNMAPTNNSRPYTRVFDGRSYEELESISYDEAKEYMKELENTVDNFTWKEESSDWDGKYLCLVFTVYKNGGQATWKIIEIDGKERYLNSTNAFCFLKTDPSIREFDHSARFTTFPTIY